MAQTVAETIPGLVLDNSLKKADRTAMCMKCFGIWQRYSWQDYYRRVKYFSLGLVQMGLKPRDVACIIGDNEPEWFWAEFAIQAAGGIATGSFVDSIPSELKYIMEHSGSSFAIANDQEQVDKFLEIKHELPSLRKIVYWDPKGLKNYDDPLLASFEQVTSLGKEYDEKNPGQFEDLVSRLQPDDTAFIYYTSGTTGLPKGAMLTHRALIRTAQSFISRYPLTEKDDLISNFPAAWVGDSYFSTIPHLLTGARLNFAEEPDTIAHDTREVGPNFVIYGPRQWEGLVSEIQVKMMDAHWLKRFVFKLFMPVGYRMADFTLEGKKPPAKWKILYAVANLLLFHPLKDKLGLSRVRFAVTGSSVLSLDTFRFIHAIGVSLRQNYASTESGYISSHSEGEIRFESLGRPARGVEVRLMDSGELWVRSDSMFSGYYNNPEKTREALYNGWCRTGDAVNIDGDGHILFLDRLEHMGELRTGAKYAPQYIEGRLRFSPYIKDAMVVGGLERDYVTAIINMDFAMVGKWAEDNHISYTTFVDLSQRDEIAGLIRQDLSRVNSYLPEQARVRKFVLMHKEFDADEAELTRTRKLRREYMEERYRKLIEAMYGGGQEVIIEAPVTYRDGRKGVVTTSIKVRSSNSQGGING
ncbi:MAG: AMP-binding protein [Dehalococcoidales bacterium]|nr:AMP-binding protein [Dehalococcoidales bacterium]MDD3264386.1 AMP-binding protein [Dehalococcoidales bacterium]MDD4322173.1 AMP-binding protein [Dehalococcoidales bacterium]MDD4793744.1 AMP-binding protein [Dehalococcoidales bacterium]MDD5121795.1 AMP-binding protein [Dehalococcoidales bacterium]